MCGSLPSREGKHERGAPTGRAVTRAACCMGFPANSLWSVHLQAKSITKSDGQTAVCPKALHLQNTYAGLG